MTARHHASVVIDAPLDLVRDMTDDVASWPELFPDYLATEVLETDGDTVRFHVTMRPDERGVSHRWTAERRADRASGTATVRQVAGHAFESMDIRWRLRQVDGGVELAWEHAFHVAEAMPYDDAAMVRLLQRTVPLQLEHIKHRIEEAAAGAVGPFRVLLRLEVQPGTRRHFEQEWLSVARGISARPGNRGQWLMRSTDEESTYYVVSEWRDAACFRTFELSAEHVENRRRLDVFRRSGSMTAMTLVHALTGAADREPV